MRGVWSPQPARFDGVPVGGAYVDVRGVDWTVTVQPPASGSGFYTFVAQSEGDDDARKYLTLSGGHVEDLLSDVDSWVAARVKSGAGSIGGLVVLALVALLVLGERRR